MCTLTHKSLWRLSTGQCQERHLFPILWFPWQHIFSKLSWLHLTLTSSLLIEEWLIRLVNLGKIMFLCWVFSFGPSGSKWPSWSRILLCSSNLSLSWAAPPLPDRAWAEGSNPWQHCLWLRGCVCLILTYQQVHGVLTLGSSLPCFVLHLPLLCLSSSSFRRRRGNGDAIFLAPFNPLLPG